MEAIPRGLVSREQMKMIPGIKCVRTNILPANSSGNYSWSASSNNRITFQIPQFPNSYVNTKRSFIRFLRNVRNTCNGLPILTTTTLLEAITSSRIGIFKRQTCVAGTNSYINEGITLDEAIEAWKVLLATPADADGDFRDDAICSKFTRNGNGFRCLNKPKPPATKEVAIQRYASEYPPETICAPLKQNSPFQCKPKTKPPATRELAIQRYAAEYPPETICAPLKLKNFTSQIVPRGGHL